MADKELFDAARRLNATVIMSKDSDFVDLVTLYGPPPRIIRLTCGNLSTIAMQAVLSRHFPDALRLLEGGASRVDIG